MSPNLVSRVQAAQKKGGGMSLIGRDVKSRFRYQPSPRFENRRDKVSASGLSAPLAARPSSCTELHLFKNQNHRRYLPLAYRMERLAKKSRNGCQRCRKRHVSPIRSVFLLNIT